MRTNQNQLEELTQNPSLIYQLKRALGDDNMSLTTALQLSLEQAMQLRGLKTALHDALCRPAGQIPQSCQRFIDAGEMKYAGIRKPRK